MISDLYFMYIIILMSTKIIVRLPPLFWKIQLAKTANSLVSLVPTRRKHQLPGFSSTNSLKVSSTNWMEAPTSNHTCTNLYNREQEFSLAPPCHPGFSGPTRWKLQLPMFKHPLEPLRTTVLPSTSQPPYDTNIFY